MHAVIFDRTPETLFPRIPRYFAKLRRSCSPPLAFCEIFREMKCPNLRQNYLRSAGPFASCLGAELPATGGLPLVPLTALAADLTPVEFFGLPRLNSLLPAHRCPA